VAIAFILLLLGVMILLFTTATGDGTVRGKIQMFMSYSISMTHFLLTLLVTFLACRTLDQDVKTMRIDSIVTKPLARWQLLLGRWIGIVILALTLLAVSMGATYGVIRYFARSAPEKSLDKFQIENQILVARHGYTPPLPDVEADVDKRVEQMKNEGAFPEDKTLREVRDVLRTELINRSRTVGPRQMQSWKFSGLNPARQGEGIITLRFKYEPSTDTSIDTESQLQSSTILGRWIVGRKELPPDRVYVWQEEKPYRTIHEINVPINAIEDDGTMTITFINLDPRGVSVHFPQADGIEVLIREGDFASNFLRTVLITSFGILFMVTLAMACGTFLSFPIAALVTLTVFFIGLGGNFLYEAVGLHYVIAPTDGLLDVVRKIIAFIFMGENPMQSIERVITIGSLAVVPKLEVSRFTSYLIEGRLVEWKIVLSAFTSLIVIKGGILALFAAAVFNRRELGKITV
jgi:hypothetical protein